MEINSARNFKAPVGSFDERDQRVVSGSDLKCGGGRAAAARRKDIYCIDGARRQQARGAGSRLEMGGSNRVAGGVGQLRVGDTQVAHLLEGGGSVDLRVHIRSDTADVAHFMKDGPKLRREEQKG
jgi:hypothetical protein